MIHVIPACVIMSKTILISSRIFVLDIFDYIFISNFFGQSQFAITSENFCNKDQITTLFWIFFSVKISRFSLIRAINLPFDYFVIMSIKKFLDASIFVSFQFESFVRFSVNWLYIQTKVQSKIYLATFFCQNSASQYSSYLFSRVIFPPLPWVCIL